MHYVKPINCVVLGNKQFNTIHECSQNSVQVLHNHSVKKENILIQNE